MRSRISRTLSGVLGALVSAGCLAAADLPGPVQAPHYGDGLFHFYQDHYFSSVTSLMVSQHFARLPPHADEAEVLRGGLLLSYGLHREAGTIFERLVETGATPSVRDRAWYYLAKIRYQRGLPAEAETAIGRIGAKLPPTLEEDRGLLHANILMARGDYAGAATLLSTLADPKANAGDAQAVGRRYARFNLGVALVRSGDAARGSALLDELGRAPAVNEEQRALRDKANVALGFAALKDDRPQDARVALERVRLNGAQSNKALLGFGWAAASMKQPKQALVPWTELAARDAGDAAVLEARIALPYALAELGARGQSLARYNDAIAEFEHEGLRLNESIGAIRAGKLLAGLLERNPGDAGEMGWFWTLDQLPQMPHAAHLAPVLSEHAFQEAFKNYRDLQFLGRNLQEWQQKLVVYEHMLANRRQAYAERLPEVKAKARASGLAELQQRRDALAAEFARAEADGDGAAFASPREREMKALVDRAGSTLKQGANEPEAADAGERLRRASGALTWQLAQAYPDRAWAARKALTVTETELAEAQQRDQALARAERDEPARFERFAARIQELEQRIKALTPRVAALDAEQQRALQDIAVAELAHQKDRLVVYETQARFAVAQLQDQAIAQQEADRAQR